MYISDQLMKPIPCSNIELKAYWLAWVTLIPYQITCLHPELRLWVSRERPASRSRFLLDERRERRVALQHLVQVEHYVGVVVQKLEGLGGGAVGVVFVQSVIIKIVENALGEEETKCHIWNRIGYWRIL